MRTPNSSDCLMYEEVRTVDMSGSAGMFAITINDGNGTRTDGSGYTLPQLLGNLGTFSFPAASCGGTNTFSPNVTDGRKLKVSFYDNGSWEDMPPVDVNFVPSAIESTQVGGFQAGSILRVQDASGAPQPATALTPANFTELMNVITGVSTQYVKSSTAGGAALPVVSGSPSSLSAGSLWYDSTAGRVKYFDGTTTQIVGTSGGSVTSVATGTGLTGGPITSSGTISLATIGSGGSGSKITYDVYGRVTASGNITGDDITSGTIGGSTNIATTGNVTATNVSGNNGAFKTVEVWKSDNSNKVTLTAPTALSTNYSLALPTSAGSANQVLQTDGAGNLSWVTPNAGTVTGVTGTLPVVVTGTSAPVISVNAATTSASGVVQLATDGQSAANVVVQGNDSRLSNSRAPSGAAGGDLAGTYPNPTIATGAVTTPKLFTNPGINRLVATDGTTGATLAPLSCTSGQLLTWNTVSGWVCTNQSALSANGVTSVTAGTGLTGGTITTTGTLAVDVGTTANKIVQLDSSAKLPAVDGSALTNLNPASLSGAVSTAKGGTGLTSIGTANQILGVNTGATGLEYKTLTAGSGVTITPAAGSLTITATGSGGTVTNVTGTAPISVATGTTTPAISIAQANGSTNGYLSSADWTTFNGKLDSSSAFAGDVSGTSSTMSVDKIKGTALSITSLTSGNYLKYNGTNWVNANLASSDVTSALGFTPVNKAGDTMTGTLNLPSNGLTVGTSQLVVSGGNVGVGTATPATKFEVNGTVKIADGGETCSLAANGGMLRYNGGNMQFCNGSSWQTLGVSGAGLTSLNGQTGSAQTFATPGTSGTAPNWTSATNAHTLNIPMASTASVTAGLLSNSDYATFNAKLGTSSTFSGDVSGTSSTMSVDKIKGTALSITSLTSGNLLRYNGTNWVNTNLVAADVPNLDWAKITTGKPTTISGYGITDAVQNAGGVPSVSSGLESARPTAGTAGRLYVATDTKRTFRDNGTTWDQLDTNASDLASGTLPTGRLPALTGDVSSSAGSNSVTLNTVPLAKGGTGLTAGGTANQVLGMNAGATGLEYKTITAGSGVTITPTAGVLTIAATGSGGTVTNVTGTAPISVATGTTTPAISIAQANGTTNGYLSSTDWTTFNSKLGTSSTFSGDVSGTSSTMSVDKIKGSPIALTAPASGNFLRFNGTNWVNTNLSASDLPSGGYDTTYFKNGGNSFGTAASLGTSDNFALSLKANNATAMTILPSGNVGIGTTSPQAKLHVVPSVAGGLGLILDKYDAAEGGEIQFNDATNTWANDINYGNFRFNLMGPNLGGYISTPMIITNTGRVGIGSTVPAYTLDVNGNIRGTQLCIGTDCRSVWPTSSSGGTVTSVTSANSDISVATTTSTPVLTLNSGTAANQIVKLDASAKLPAVDGSALTNLNAAALTSGTIAAARMPALTGDVTMTAGTTATTVAKIQTTPVTITTLTSGNFLKYNGTAWVNVTPSSADLSDAGSLIKSSQMPANCGAGQTLTFSSPTGTWVCSNITVTASNFGSQTANTFLAAPNGSAGAPTFRTLASADLPSISSGLTGILPVANGGTGTSNGSITGTGALAFAAGGTNQNVTLTPSGTGATILNGYVGIGTATPSAPIETNFSGTDLSASSGYRAIKFFSTDTLSVDANKTYSGAYLSPTVNQNGFNALTANGALIGLEVSPQTTGSSGTVTSVYGVLSAGVNATAGGTVAHWADFYAGPVTTTGTVTNLYGYAAGNPASGAALNYSSPVNTYGFWSKVNAGATNYAFYAAGTAQSYLAGNLGLSVTAPTAKLHLGAGSATASTAPLKFTSGTNLTTPENGAMEYDGSSFYLTTGGTRYPIPLSGGASTFTTVGAGAGSAAAPSHTFSGDSDTGFYDASSNNVISVAAGGVKIFDLSSAGLVSPTTGGADITTANGTASAPTYSYAGDTGTGWFRAAASNLAASTGGTERMRIDASGNIGIGTTSPMSNLDVLNGGWISARNSANDASLMLTANNGSYGQVQARNFANTANSNLVLQSLGGNVGIGTTAPQSKLEVFGDGQVLAQRASSAAGLASVWAEANDFYSTPTYVGVGLTQFGSSASGSTSGVANAGLGVLQFQNDLNAMIRTNGSAPLIIATLDTERMRIAGNGNVGIGSTNPQYPLTVTSAPANQAGVEQYGAYVSTTFSTADTNYKTGIRANTLDNNTSGAQSLMVGMQALNVGAGSGGTTTQSIAFWGRNDANSGHTITNSYDFYAAATGSAGTVTNEYGLYVEQLTKGTNKWSVYTAGSTPSYFGGNVGIGTTSPVHKLHITDGTSDSSTTPALASISSTTSNAAALRFHKAGSVEYTAGIDTSNNLRIVSTTGAAAVSSSASGLTLTGTGNVGIGTTSPTSKLQVAGAIVSTTNPIASGVSVDLSVSNTHTLAAPGAAAITLTNMADGGSYTIVITDTANSRQYTFGGCTNSYFRPANAPTTTGTRTVYGILTIKNGANWDCYINWTSGYQ